jgi:mannose-6-phosphate isomerase-like protein (cupin superfamily)
VLSSYDRRHVSVLSSGRRRFAHAARALTTPLALVTRGPAVRELSPPQPTPGPPDRSDYRELHRSSDLSVGVYDLPVGGDDPQQPHTEDEVYVVHAGRARLAGPEQSITVGPGSVVFVAAGEEHRFVDVEEPLSVVVVFGPAEHTRREP